MRLRSRVRWGLIDQVLSSGTNFGLALVAGRLLGPSGLGVVTIGFTTVMALVVLQRYLLSEPLTITTSNAPRGARSEKTAAAITTSILFALAAASLALTVGGLLGGTLGTAFRVFALWIPGVLLQDLWRGVLFREGRGRDATINDAIWMIAMLTALSLVASRPSAQLIVSTWGFGALMAAAAGFIQLRLIPGALAAARRWWFDEAWPLGRWSGLEAISEMAGNVGFFVLVGSLLGPAAAGGMSAARVVFAPVTLIAPAISLPALPAMTQSLASSRREAGRLTKRLIGVFLGLTVAYYAMVGLVRDPLLSLLFGHRFVQYGALIFPVGLSQLSVALAMGPFLLLRASRAARALLLIKLLSAVCILTFVAVSAFAGADVFGAAWAYGAGLGVGVAVGLWLAPAAGRLEAPGSLRSRLVAPSVSRLGPDAADARKSALDHPDVYP